MYCDLAHASHTTQDARVERSWIWVWRAGMSVGVDMSVAWIQTLAWMWAQACRAFGCVGARRCGGAISTLYNL